MNVSGRPSSNDICTVYVEGSLRAPIQTNLRHEVRALLRRGARKIVVDLAQVPAIDAAGIGELVRLYNMTSAVNGALRVVHTTARVGDLIGRVGLLSVLAAERISPSQPAGSVLQSGTCAVLVQWPRSILRQVH